MFFVTAIFQINICEAKVFVFKSEIYGTTFSNAFNSEKFSIQFENVFLERGFKNTCKSERYLFKL